MATKPTFESSSLESSVTLQSQIARLKYYINLLRQEAKYLGNGLAGEQADKLEKIVVNSESGNSDLEAITEALLTIEKKQVLVEGDIAEGQTITVQKGYYDKDTVIEIQGTDDTTEVTNAPTPDEVVSGKDYWANGSHLTGTLVDNSDKTVDATSTNKAEAKEGDTITVTVPKAKYDEDSVINTGIVARTTYEYDAEVTVSKDEEGNNHAEVKSFDIPAGYYDKPITVNQIFQDGDDYESVINVKDFVISESGTFDPHAEKYDYYSKVSVDAAAIKGTAAAEDLNIPTATVSVKVTNKGYTDENSYDVVLPTQTAPTAVDAEASEETANVVVTPNVSKEQTVTVPAGLYTQDTIIKVSSMSSGEALSDDNITIKDTPVENKNKDGYTVIVTVDKSGYISAGDYETSDLDKSSVSVTNVTNGEITEPTVVITTNEGYTKGETINLSVQEATFGGSNIAVAPNKLVITPTQNGWFTGEEFNLAGQVNALVDTLATTEDALFEYDDVKNLEYGKNTTKYAGGEGLYYKKAETDLTDLVVELSEL